MDNALDEKRTAVIATYPSRRSAEQAKSRLEQENIRAMITADDAGGAHLDLQAAHGVDLRVLEDQAAKALRTLKDTQRSPQAEVTGSALAAEEKPAVQNRFVRTTAQVLLGVLGLLVLVIIVGMLLSVLS